MIKERRRKMIMVQRVSSEENHNSKRHVRAELPVEFRGGVMDGGSMWSLSCIWVSFEVSFTSAFAFGKIVTLSKRCWWDQALALNNWLWPKREGKRKEREERRRKKSHTFLPSSFPFPNSCCWCADNKKAFPYPSFSLICAQSRSSRFSSLQTTTLPCNQHTLLLLLLLV